MCQALEESLAYSKHTIMLAAFIRVVAVVIFLSHFCAQTFCLSKNVGDLDIDIDVGDLQKSGRMTLSSFTSH